MQMFLIILLANFFLTSAALSVGLESGHYETASIACAFNVEPMGGHYYTEATDSDERECLGRGTLVLMRQVGNATYGFYGDGTERGSEWVVISSTAFIAYPVAKGSDDTWVRGEGMLYRKVPECR